MFAERFVTPVPVDRIMAEQRLSMGLGPMFDPPTIPVRADRPFRLEALRPLAAAERVIDQGNGTLTTFDASRPLQPTRTFSLDLSRYGVYVEDP